MNKGGFFLRDCGAASVGECKQMIWRAKRSNQRLALETAT